MRRFGIYHFPSDGIEVYCCSIPVGKPDSLVEKVGVGAFKRVMKRIIKRFGAPDIIHAHFGEIARYASAYRQKSDIKLVITEHSSAMNTDTPDEGLLRAMRTVYKRGDRLIAVSSALASHIEHTMGVKAEVVHNIVQTEEFASCVKNRASVGEESFCFVSAGNLNYGKGFDLLIKAFDRLNERNIDAKLVIMGGGDEEMSLRSLADGFDRIKGKIEFTGKYQRGEFAERLTSAQAFVLATRGETFGVVFAEAMAAGLPVIATACGGPEDFVTEDNGILVPVGDVEALTDAMERMYRNIGAYDQMKISADTIKKFSPEQIAERITAVYAELAGADR